MLIQFTFFTFHAFFMVAPPTYVYNLKSTFIFNLLKCVHFISCEPTTQITIAPNFGTKKVNKTSMNYM